MLGLRTASWGSGSDKLLPSAWAPSKKGVLGVGWGGVGEGFRLSNSTVRLLGLPVDGW